MCSTSISPSKQLDKRDRKGNFQGNVPMNAPQRLCDSQITGSLHDIHYKAELGKKHRELSDLSAAKQTPAALSSVSGAERHCPEAAACLK